MRPDDLGLFRVPGQPTISADGRHAIVAVSRPDLDADEYRSRLWLVAVDGSGVRAFTQGDKDSSPRYSPDGRWVCFLRPDARKHPQLHVLPADGGEARVLTDHPLGVVDPRWSPDSKRIAYTAAIPEAGRYGTTEGVTPDKEPPRLFTRLRFRLDGEGFLDDRPSKVFVVDLPPDDASELPTPTQVTDGPESDSDVRWSPDGNLLAFVSAPVVDPDTSLASDVYVCAPDGAGRRALTRSDQSVREPAFTPDGTRVVYVGSGDLGPGGLDFVANQAGVWVVPVGGDAAPTRLTDPETLNVTGALVVVPDAVLTAAVERGTQPLLRIPLAGGDPEPVVSGDVAITAFDSVGGVTVASIADPGSFGEVHRIDATGSTALTDFGAELTARGGIRPPEELIATSADGYPVHGWVIRPAGEGPHPVLLNIHGGPFAQYQSALFDEAQVYAGAGYAVLMCNPRGSGGYGAVHGRAIQHAVGTVDVQDILAFLDAALAAPDLDADRVGVMGGSYGGLMTTWLLGHTDRFAAGISERALNAWDSFSGTSDIGWYFTKGYVGDDVDAVARQSPLNYAHRIRTPTLVIHSEQDWRCPVEQAQRLWVLLKRNGVDTEFLLFPGEGHELSRAGRPMHRLARFEHILRWWARHLPTALNREPANAASSMSAGVPAAATADAGRSNASGGAGPAGPAGTEGT